MPHNVIASAWTANRLPGPDSAPHHVPMDTRKPLLGQRATAHCGRGQIALGVARDEMVELDSLLAMRLAQAFAVGVQVIDDAFLQALDAT